MLVAKVEAGRMCNAQYWTQPEPAREPGSHLCMLAFDSCHRTPEDGTDTR